MTQNADWNRSTTHSGQNCYPCLQNKVSPMSQEGHTETAIVLTRLVPLWRPVVAAPKGRLLLASLPLGRRFLPRNHAHKHRPPDRE